MWVLRIWHLFIVIVTPWSSFWWPMILTCPFIQAFKEADINHNHVEKLESQSSDLTVITRRNLSTKTLIYIVLWNSKHISKSELDDEIKKKYIYI